MKPLFNIYLCLFASLLFIAACNDSDEEGITGFTIDTQEVTLGATGGMEPVKVASGTKWVAKVDKPWVKVMPANGVGSTNCEIVVDSTLSNDVRHAVVTFVPEGQPKQELKIHQTGYGKMIGLDKYEVEVPNMGNADKRYFDISVTTNVSLPVRYVGSLHGRRVERGDTSYYKQPSGLAARGRAFRYSFLFVPHHQGDQRRTGTQRNGIACQT